MCLDARATEPLSAGGASTRLAGQVPPGRRAGQQRLLVVQVTAPRLWATGRRRDHEAYDSDAGPVLQSTHPARAAAGSPTRS